MSKKWRNLTISALLGAMAYLLMYIAIPIIPIVPYMTLDFSGVLILLAFLIFGRKNGYVALFIKEILHLILGGVSLSNLIGVFSDAIALIVLGELIFLGSQKGKQHFIRATLIATVGMTVVMAAANLWFIMPVYMKVLGMKLSIPLPKLILFGAVPFNLIKGILVSGVTFLLLPRLKKVLNPER